jgi:tetratricopeptide (TPR) repeat protein
MAVELARKAVELEPRQRDFWKTLGAAQYRAGDWKACVAALDRARPPGEGGDGAACFFLAMARWQLGDKEQARRCYERAVRWMELNRPQDKQLARFRAEAAALLGSADQTAGP